MSTRKGKKCACMCIFVLQIFHVFHVQIMTQTPRTSRASLVKGRSQANPVAQQALVAHWQSIVKSLNNYLKIMRANYVSGTYKYNEIVSLFCFLNSVNSLQNCDNTGPSIPSLQSIHSDIFLYQCSVI